MRTDSSFGYSCAIKCVNCVSFKWYKKHTKMKWNGIHAINCEMSCRRYCFTPPHCGKWEIGRGFDSTIQYVLYWTLQDILIVCIRSVILFLLLRLLFHHAHAIITLFIIIFMYSQMARTFALRMARIAATIFIHNNRLNECQLHRLKIGVRYVCSLQRKLCSKLCCFFVVVVAVENARKSNEGEWYESEVIGETVVEM